MKFADFAKPVKYVSFITPWLTNSYECTTNGNPVCDGSGFEVYVLTTKVQADGTVSTQGNLNADGTIDFYDNSVRCTDPTASSGQDVDCQGLVGTAILIRKSNLSATFYNPPTLYPRISISELAIYAEYA